MFACNATGEKLKPLVIGKSQKPRCFKNINVGRLPVTYVANKKAWMTTQIFTSWITSVNKIMVRQKRKIIMFLDNATSHGPDLQLSNVNLKFLPPNTTSHLQPLDQGIIRAFKARYRKHMLRYLVCRIEVADNATELCKQLTLLDAINWLASAWDETKESTISKCFVGAGFSATGSVAEEDEEDEDDIPLARLAHELDANIDTNRLDQFDDNAPIEDNSDNWENELLINFRAGDHDESEDNHSDYEVEPDISVPTGSDMTYVEVLEMVNKLKNFAVYKDERFLKHVQDIESLTQATIVKQRCARRQVTMEHFVKPDC